ncbi:MAG: hypothetical protein P1R58_09385 [bacterium]|nr:hypothetical protein [bacterium]
MKNNRTLKSSFVTVFTGLLTILTLGAHTAQAGFDYIFFSVNGDTTVSTMIQGDELAWGSNCDLGATINWEIWYDFNSNSQIDPGTDYLLSSEHMTDGNLLYDNDPIPDGWIMTSPFKISIEPGTVVFRAIDFVTDISIQKVMTVSAGPAAPNQVTGQIILPGVTAPNSFLANHIIIAESDNDNAGVYLATTNDSGFYSLDIGAAGSGFDFYLQPTNVSGFVTPGMIVATASGVVPNNDFTFDSAVDSIWGFVRDDLGALLTIETDVSLYGQAMGSTEKETTTESGRYVLYLSGSESGEWVIEASSQHSPIFVAPDGLSFNLDTLTSFQQDLTLLRTDTAIFVTVTENGAPAANNYMIYAYSYALASGSEAVSGTGADNTAVLPISSLDNSGWSVEMNTWDQDYQIPMGMITESGGLDNLAPGDSVTINLIAGKLVAGAIVQDPEDAPINWDNVFVGAGNYGATADGGGGYALYTDTGSYILGVYADNYTADPAWRLIEVTGDTTVGLGFTINETHCNVSGTLLNVTLPLDNPYYMVTAQTGLSGFDGYYVSAQVDSATGIYSMNLCDGDWTISAPFALSGGIPPAPVMITIGEQPDNSRIVDFDYSSGIGCCLVPGDANGSGDEDISDLTYFVDFMFAGGSGPLCMEEFDNDGNCALDITDLTVFVSYMFSGGAPPPPCHDCLK